eukprot:TRINITY_DN42607_c0_g1_i1.p1 TRINITY_DN42607_c0_g1~~TRINITY_DN42607_c0_g1_i1.p1  ORF type:complete len:238 (-),score=67.64 TRINITY_DN42607_c0_g1_i1:312-992(-)
MQDIIAPLLELFNNKEVQARMMDTLETARIYYTGTDITINLIWSILIFGGLLLLLKPLLGIPLLDNILGAMTGSSPSYGSGISDGYGAPDAGYGAPDAGYGAPDAGYGAPDAGYGAPDAGYGAPDAGYGAPSGGAGGAGYDAPAGGDSYGAPAGGAGYDAPSSGYDSPAPQSGYSRGRRSVTLSEEQKSVHKLANSMDSSSAGHFLTQRLALPAQAQLSNPVNLLN